MKNTKLFLGSLAIACALSACSHKDEAVVATPEATLAGRAQVNLVLGSPAETRLQVNADGASVGFTTNDQLGAVLVDSGIDANGQINWGIASGHVGNNKWFWDGDKFTTEGTTAVGAWLFYSMYDEAMTSKRAGVEFSFPQIQDGAADLSLVANNNINFHISPVVKFDGAEGDNLNIPVEYASVYNYLNIKLAFEEAGVTSVEKIVVSAKNTNNGWVQFPAKSKVVNTALPVAMMSTNTGRTEITDDVTNVTTLVPNHNGSVTKVDGTNYATYDAEDLELEMHRAYAALSDVTLTYDAEHSKWNNAEYNWNNSKVGTLTQGIGNAKYDYLVVDCGAHSKDLAVVDGKFSTWMLMPAGVYGSLKLEIYTNKGVYTKIVNGYDFYKENKVTNNVRGTATVSENGIVLRPQALTSIANIKNATGADAQNDYLFIAKGAANTAQPLGDIVTNNAELINLINRIAKNTASGATSVAPCNVTIVKQSEINGGTDAAIGAHGVVIDESVMAAIEAKEAAIGQDIQLVFNGSEIVKIQGNDTAADRLDIHDMTFTAGCEVIGGYVSTSMELVGTKMTVKAGDVAFGTNVEVINRVTYIRDAVAKVLVEKNGVASIAGDYKNITEIEVKGALTVNEGVTLGVATLKNNKGAVVVNGAVDAVYKVLDKASTTTNNGQMKVGADSEFDGTVANSGTINIVGNTINKANGVITNNANAFILVNKSDITRAPYFPGGWWGNDDDDDDDNNGGNNPGGNNTQPSATVVEFTNNGKIVNYGYFYTQNAAESSSIVNKIHNLGTIDAKAGSTTLITTNSQADQTVTATNAASGQKMGVVNVEERNNAYMTVAIEKQQGYIVYAVSASDLVDGVFSAKEGDNFNKIILSDVATLDANLVGSVLYVETSKNLTLPKYVVTSGTTKTEYPFVLKSLTFTQTASLVAPELNVNEFNMSKDVLLTIPRGSKVNVLSNVSTTGYAQAANLALSKTNVAIHNYGEIILAGKFTSDLSASNAKTQSTLKNSSGTVIATGIFGSASGVPGDGYTWGTM